MRKTEELEEKIKDLTTMLSAKERELGLERRENRNLRDAILNRFVADNQDGPI